ncbi:MAG: NAD+ synthase [Gemmatimonadetes bacterium]|nr:NAD+ synthase [Gemmatimonadota bacterium]
MSLLRLAVAQIRPAKGDYAANLQHIAAVFGGLKANPQPAQLVVFPETATSGYFVEGGVRDVAVTAGTLLRDLTAAHKEAKAPPVDVSVGFYEVFQNRFYNSCLYASLGGKKQVMRNVHRKIFLPTYGVFDEERFVERGKDIRAFETGWGGRAAILICEDAWHSLAATVAAVQGAQVILVPSASPARGTGAAADPGGLPASVLRWERTARGIAEEHGVFVVFASLVGFEGGKGFPGGSIVVGPAGDIIARGPLFEEGIVSATLDLDQLTRARADAPLLADLEVALPHLIATLGKREKGKGKNRAPLEFDEATNGAPPGPIAPGGAAPHPLDADPLSIDGELVARWLTEFLKDEVLRRRGFQKGIVAMSGGVDSSVTAHLAVRALGKENVIGVALPHKSSSPESFEHAELVANQLGIELRKLDITDAVEGYYKAIGAPADPTRRGNVMARVRMVALFDLSAALRALPLGTSNKTERLLGYFTWHADDAPAVNPLGDLYKTQVWALARHLGVPDVIVGKAPTADLVRGQTDEGDLGITYAKADLILHGLLSGHWAEAIVATGFTAAEVELVRKRLESTHWKRRLPTVAMLSNTAIGESYLRPVDY